MLTADYEKKNSIKLNLKINTKYIGYIYPAEIQKKNFLNKVTNKNKILTADFDTWS